MKFKLLIITLFICTLCFSQNKGTVSGIISDKDLNNEPLAFANVMIKGTTIGASTDALGKYSLSVEPGNHILQISFVGYESIDVPFTVKANETVTINKTIGSGSVKLEDIVIKSTGGREKETALLLEQKNAVEIKQSIGAQEMSRKGVSDVEQGLTKITGITKVDSRGLFVRGLEDRYNNLLINDLAAPTNNPFKKIIPLDLFSTDIVGVIDVFKTFNPNIYGDFAGGTFNIQTSKGTKSITKLTLGIGYTTNNNLEKFLLSKDADNTKGFFGFNGKDRELPSVLGSTPSNHQLTSSESQQGFKSGFDVAQIKSPLNSNISFLHSEKFTLKNDNKFSYLLSLNFDNNYSVRSGAERTFDAATGGFTYINNLLTTEYKYKATTSTLLGLNYSTQKLKLAWNTLYIKTNENSIKDQVGIFEKNTLEPNHIIRTNQLDKTDYLNTQLLGEYALTEKQSLKGGFSFAKTDYSQPDRKFFGGNLNGDQITTSYGGNNFIRQYLTVDGNYYFSSLLEYGLKFGKQNKFTFGYNGFATSMESSYRFINSGGDVGLFDTSINNIDTNIQSNLAGNHMFFIENSNNTFKVKLKESVNTGYANLLLKFAEKWEINGGVRIENSVKETNYKVLGLFSDPFITKKYNNFYILPSINAKYEVTEKSNIRFAASKTYTKPVLMEAFPLAYLNADGTSVQGNNILKNSDNYNADLKLEVFPTAKEMFAIGLFGKYIKNPIERTFIANATTSTIETFLNSDSANLYGAEAEFILGLERINKNLSDFSLGFNASLMSTKVKVSDYFQSEASDGTITNKPSIETHQSRELQGASKWMINSDLKYQFNFDKSWSNTVTLVYAVFGKRIYGVGTNGQDHIFELPYQKLDLVWSSKMSEHFDLKFSADNLLNPARQLELGNDGTANIAESSGIIKSYKRGVGFSLTLGYTF